MATSLRYFIEAAKYRVILLDIRTKIYSTLYIVIIHWRISVANVNLIFYLISLIFKTRDF